MKERAALVIGLYVLMFSILFAPRLMDVYFLRYPSSALWVLKKGKIIIFNGKIGYRGIATAFTTSFRLDGDDYKSSALGCHTPASMSNCGLSISYLKSLDGRNAQVYLLDEDTIAELIVDGHKIVSRKDTEKMFTEKKREKLISILQSLFLYSFLYLLVCFLFKRTENDYKL